VLNPLDVDVDKEAIELSVVESAVESESTAVDVEVDRLSTELVTVLNPLEVDVDKEATELSVVESPVESESTTVEVEVDRLSTEL
jgi:pilus assembly protein FimV